MHRKCRYLLTRVGIYGSMRATELVFCVVVALRYASQPDSCTDLPPPSAKYADLKTSWPPEPTGHKSWKASRGSSQNQLSRPPPGLGSQKQPSPSPWSGGGPRFAGRGWGSGSSTTGKGSLDCSCCLAVNNVLFFSSSSSSSSSI